MELQEYKIMYEVEDDYWWYRGLHELVLDTLKRYYGGQNDIAIFDAGCGTGRMLELLSDYGNKEGVDYSSEAIDFCLKRGLANVHVEDLSKWEPEENAYDCVMSLDVICNINHDMEAIGKFYRALKPGGVLIMNLPAFMLLRRQHDIAVWSKRRYRTGNTKLTLQNIGFQTEIVAYRLPWLFPIMLAQKFREYLFHPEKTESDLKGLPPFLNKILLAAHLFDNKLILNGISWPCGGSVFVVAKK